MSRLSAVAGVLVLGLVGCDGPNGRDPSLAIVFPLDGAEIDFAADTLPGTPALNFDVVVMGEYLEAGDQVTLTGDSSTATVAFTGNPITFRDFELGSATGTVTLVASMGSVSSTPVTVTLVRDGTFCPTVDITDPPNGATLRAEHDEQPGESGFQYTVLASTNAGSGARAVLYLDGMSTGEAAVVSGTLARFEAVTLSEGTHVYEVRIEGAPSSCDWPVLTVTVDTDAPECSFVDMPDGDPCLNRGDDVNAAIPGMQIDVAVATEGGESVTVELLVDGVPCSADCQVATATGRADFGEVDLAEGDRVLRAHCVDSSGNETVSAPLAYRVDSFPPSLTITSPAAGSFITVDALPEAPGHQVEVCLETSVEAEGEQAEAYVPGSAPDPTFGLATVSGRRACMHVTVSPRTTEIEARVADGCGNQATASVGDLQVDTEHPDVQIVEPADGASLCMADDEVPATTDFEHTVVACASEPVVCQLQVNASPVAAGVSSTAATCTLADGTSMPNTVTFAAARIRDGASTLSVLCVDEAGQDGTNSADITVDNTPPTVTIYQPQPCGETYSTADSPFTISVRQDAPTTVHVEDASGTEVFVETRTSGTGFAFYGPVSLPVGRYFIWAEATDACGNRGATSRRPCDCSDPSCLWLEVTASYTLAVSSPDRDDTLLGPAQDRDPSGAYAARVCVRSSSVPAGTPLHVEVDSVEIPGSPFSFVPTDHCLDVPLTEGRRAIRAWVLDGTGTTVAATRYVIVDLTPPGTPTDLAVSVLNRRESSLRATWNAPAGEEAAAHIVRWSHGPIVTAGDFSAAHNVLWTGGTVPPAGSLTFDIRNLVIERDYYVAVAALDAAGNVSDFVATPSSLRPEFLVTLTTTAAPSSYFGESIAGAGDLDSDGIEDMVAGGAGGARVFFGPPPLSGEWHPDLVISVPGDWAVVAGVGDFNGDGQPDLAVGDPFGGASLQGALHIFYGGTGRDWAATTSSATADVSISGTEAFGFFGVRVAPAGDFCGTSAGRDGLLDIAVAASGARSYQGSVYVVCGAALVGPVGATLDTIDTTVLRIDGVHSTSPSISFGVPGLAGLGDTNGDGRDDIAIGLNLYDSGRAYVIGGLPMSTIDAFTTPATDRRGTLLVTDATYVATFSGESSGDRFGEAVAGVGDLNGDGNADLVVGAPRYGASDAGRIYVYQSTATGIGTGRMTIDPSWSGAAGDQFGVAVASGAQGLGGAPDRSLVSLASGLYPDLLVSALYSDSGAGNLAIAFGGTGIFGAGSSITTSALADNLATAEPQDGPGLVLSSPAIGSSSAYLSYLGDVDGDGWLDLAVSDTIIGSRGGRVVVLH